MRCELCILYTPVTVYLCMHAGSHVECRNHCAREGTVRVKHYCILQDGTLRAVHSPGCNLFDVINIKRGCLRGCLWVDKSGIDEYAPMCIGKISRVNKLSRMNCFRARTIKSFGSTPRVITFWYKVPQPSRKMQSLA